MIRTNLTTVVFVTALFVFAGCSGKPQPMINTLPFTSASQVKKIRWFSVTKEVVITKQIQIQDVVSILTNRTVATTPNSKKLVWHSGLEFYVGSTNAICTVNLYSNDRVTIGDTYYIVRPDLVKSIEARVAEFQRQNEQTENAEPKHPR